MGGVAFYGFYQLRDEVIALFELYVDIGKCVFAFLPEGDEAVIEYDEQCYDRADNS